MTTAFVFAGQGVEPPWVAEDIVAQPSSRALAAAASEVTGLDIGRLLVRGGPQLAQTAVLQPAMIAACLMVVGVLAEAGVQPDIVCGHSLGEMAAWSATGAVAAVDAIRVTGVRGQLMAREAARHPGAMAAISSREIAAVLDHGRQHGWISLAAENTVDEHVVAGSEAAIAAVVATFRCKRLAVAGAWHSQAMAGAVDEFTAALTAVPAGEARARFVSNFDGAVTAAADLPARLAGQLVHPIRWLAVASTLSSLGVDRFVVVGPGRLMRAMLRATIPTADVRVVEAMRDLRHLA